MSRLPLLPSKYRAYKHGEDFGTSLADTSEAVCTSYLLAAEAALKNFASKIGACERQESANVRESMSRKVRVSRSILADRIKIE
jgi:hypothetical protein